MSDTSPTEELWQFRTFWRRVGALLFDSGLLYMCGAGIAFIFSLSGGSSAFLLYYFINGSIGLCYVILNTYWTGGTPGKRIFNLRVVRAIDQKAISFGQSILRQIPYVIFFLVYLGIMIGEAISSSVSGIASIFGSTSKSSWSQAYSYLTSALYCADAVVCLFSAKKRALHDFIAGTVVVKNNSVKWYYVLLSILMAVVGLMLSLRAFALLRSTAVG